MVKAVENLKEKPRVEGITLRFKDVSGKMLHEALEKLDAFTGWKDPKDIHRFNKFKNTFEREHKKAGHWYRKLVDRHAVLEEVKKKSEITGQMEPQRDPKTGKVITKPKWAPNEFGKMDIVMKDPAAFEKDVTIFHNHEFTVNVYKFRSDDLVKAGLTPAELRACARIAEDMDPELLENEDELDVETEVVPDDLADLFPDEEPVQNDGASNGPAAG